MGWSLTVIKCHLLAVRGTLSTSWRLAGWKLLQCNRTLTLLFPIIIILIYLEHQIISKLWISLFSPDLIENNLFISFIIWSTGISSLFSSPPSPPVLVLKFSPSLLSCGFTAAVAHRLWYALFARRVSPEPRERRGTEERGESAYVFPWNDISVVVVLHSH